MKAILCEKPFLSIQGEGNYIGVPAVFIRFSGCNLSCPGCDTKYHKDGFETTTEEIIKDILELNPLTKCVVFTGGEPLLQEEAIAEIIKELKPVYRPRHGVPSYSHWWFQIETNGTKEPKLLNKMDDSIIQFNVSPKLAGFNIEGFKIKLFPYWYLSEPSYILKFVVSDETDVQDALIIAEELKTNKEKIYLMPEGKTKEKQEAKIQDIINLAIKYGVNFTPRLHVLVWNTRKGV